jgi:SAM-dependent methyltransferase
MILGADIKIMPDSDKGIGFIRSMARGFKESLMLKTAVEYEVFTLVKSSPKTASEIADEVGVDERGMELLLNALVTNELLEKRDGQFHNTEVSSSFLVKGEKGYQGDYVEYTTSLVPFYMNLTENVERGKAPKDALEQILGKDEKLTEKFFGAMHSNAVPGAKFLSDNLEKLEEAEKIYDVGGGTGAYPIIFCRNHPNIDEAVVTDLPYVINNITPQYVEDSGLGDRIRTKVENYKEESFEDGNDVILQNAIIHQHSPDVARDLFKKAHDALNEDGELVVSTFFAEEEGTQPRFSAMFGLEVLALMPEGHLWNLDETQNLLKEVGFSGLEVLSPPGPPKFIVAKK